MKASVRILLATSVAATTALSAAAAPAAAQPADSERQELRAKLLTAQEFSGASTRTGWFVRRDRGQFDCGTVEQTTAADVRVRRDFATNVDASGLAHVARFATRAEARLVFAAVKRMVRDCESSPEDVTVRRKYDEEVAGPGQVRMIQMFFRAKDAGADTHSFGVIRHKRKVAILHLGEMGRSQVVPMRDTVTLAARKLAG